MADTTEPVVEVTEASTTQSELEAKIDQELGLPTQPKTEEPEPEQEEESPETPETPAEEEPEQEPEETPEEEPVPEAPKPEPAQPSDEELFVEVEDAEGVTHKISKIEDLPTDFAPKNNRQILEIIKATDKLDAERAQREADAVKAEEAALIEQTQQEQFQSWDNEIAELAKNDSNLKDGEYVNSVFGYMNEINNARQKAGNPNLVTSFEDALEKYQANQTKVEAEQAKVNDNAKAKAKTALIGRSSASASGNNYVYRAGSARNIDDIPVEI